MRQITKESVAHFLSSTPFKKANMQVQVIATEGGKPSITHLELHGNVIAELITNKRKNKLFISNCGWESNTTKERLNALPNVSIQQKNFVWFLNGKEWNGERTEIKL